MQKVEGSTDPASTSSVAAEQPASACSDLKSKDSQFFEVLHGFTQRCDHAIGQPCTALEAERLHWGVALGVAGTLQT